MANYTDNTINVISSIIIVIAVIVGLGIVYAIYDKNKKNNDI